MLAKRAAIGGDGAPGNQHYGTLIGCWLEQGLLGSREEGQDAYRAGMRLVAIVTTHDRLLGLPRPPRALALDAVHGRSLAAEDESKYRRVMDAMESAKAVVMRRDASGSMWRATLDAARDIVTPSGGDRLARAGLKALAEHRQRVREAA